jgi:hypothetical protein
MAVDRAPLSGSRDGRLLGIAEGASGVSADGRWVGSLVDGEVEGKGADGPSCRGDFVSNGIASEGRASRMKQYLPLKTRPSSWIVFDPFGRTEKRWHLCVCARARAR